MRDDIAREDLALQASQSPKTDSQIVAAQSDGGAASANFILAPAGSLRLFENSVVLNSFKVAQASSAVVPPDGSAAVTVIKPNDAGVVILPTGAKIALIQISGSDLRIVLADGSILVVEGAAGSPPSIQIDSETIPGASLTSVFGPFQKVQPAADDLLPSAGGLGFAVTPTTIDQAFQFSGLLDAGAINFSGRETADKIGGGGGGSGGGLSSAASPVVGTQASLSLDENMLDIPVGVFAISVAQSGQLFYSFGPNGPDSSNPITFDAQALTDLCLTAGGAAVTFAWDAVSRTLTGIADGNVVFSLVVSDPFSGAYEVTLSAAFDHAAQGNDTLTLPISFVVRDSEGVETVGVLNAAITDDIPDASDVPAGGDENTTIVINLSQGAGTDFHGGADGLASIAAGTATIANSHGLALPVPAISFNASTLELTLIVGSDFDAMALGETALVTIPYTVTDGDGDTAIGNILVTIVGTNDAPRAESFAVQGAEDSLIQVTLIGSDIDGTVAGYSIKSLPANGTLWLNADGTGAVAINQQVSGTIYFEPTVDWNGDTSFDYAAVDNDGAESANATVSLAVNPGNDAPKAENVSTSGDEDSILTIAFDGADTDGTVVGFVIRSLPLNGTLWLNSDGTGAVALNQQVSGTIYFEPNANWNGNSSFDYAAIDNEGTESVSAIVALNVDSVNDAPTAENIAPSGNEDTTITVTLEGADIDGTIAGFILKSSPTSGTLYRDLARTQPLADDDVVAGDTIYFRGPNNFNGQVQFTYAAVDNDGAESATATATIDVLPVNDQPFITSGSQTGLMSEVADNAAGENVTVHTRSGTVTFTDVDAGDTHITYAQPFSISYSSVAVSFTPQQIAALQAGFSIGSLDQNNKSVGWTYTISDAAIDFLGTATANMSFRVFIEDNNGSLTWQVVNISIFGANDTPVITSNDTYSVSENTTAVGTITSFDPDIGALRQYSITGGADAGKFNIDSETGALTFKTAPNFENPTDANGDNVYHVRVLVWDRIGGSPGATQDISVTVTNVNEAPAAQNASFDVSEDAALSGSVLATDPDNNPLTYSLVDPVDGIVLNSDGTFTFTLDAALQNLNDGESVAVMFQYRVNDGALDSNIATVTITVHGANENGAPTAENVLATGDEDTIIAVALSGSDNEGPVNFIVKSLPVNGTLWLNANGTDAVMVGQLVSAALYFQPVANWNGDTSFTYAAIDASNVESPVATVSIAIVPVNDAPVAQGASFNVSEDGVLTGALMATDVDIEPLTYSLVAPVAGLVLSADGTFTYTPGAAYQNLNDGESAQVSFLYRANDGTANSNTATGTITINGASDNVAPTANNVSASGNEDATITVTLQGNDADGDLDGFIIKSLPTDGTLWLNANGTGAVAINQQVSGTLYFQPNVNFSGEVEFEYTAVDAEGAESAEATASIAVSPIADAPALQVIGAGAGKLFFNATTAAHGGELWSFDGTTAQRVTDISAGAESSNAGQNAIYEYNGKLFFMARDAINNYELWSYDGTNVTLEADIAAGSDASSHAGNFGFIEYEGKLFFGANGGTGIELWSFDGITAQLEAEINPGAGNGSSNPDQGGFAVYNGKLYFSAQNDTIGGHEFWSFDGNTATMVAEIHSGIDGSTPRNFKEFNGKLYFSATDGGAANGAELWSFDGTTVQLAANINPGPASSFAGLESGFTEYNGKLYFSAQHALGGFEIWSFDGTTAALAADIRTGTNSSFAGDTGGFTEFNGKLYFSATSGPINYELWSFDGTTAVQVADINVGSLPSNAGRAGFAVYDGKLYFAASTDGMNNELWSYDGINPPQLAVDINGTSTSSNAGQGPMVVFGAGGPIGGDEDTLITLPVINASLTDIDGSEALTIALSGYPAGATFSVGELDVLSGSPTFGKWIVTDPAEIASLGTTQMTMTPPANWNGTFTLTIEAITTDTATLSTGVETDKYTETVTVDVTIDAVANTLVGGPGADVFQFTSLDVTDVIQDYSGLGGEGDVIDLSALFENDNPLGNGIVSHVGNELRIDLDGAGPENYAVAATFVSNPAANTISILYTDTNHQQQTMVI